MEVNNNFPTNYPKWPLFCCLCNVQLDYKDNLLETIVNLQDFYSSNLWRILSGGLGWSSHTVIIYWGSHISLSWFFMQVLYTPSRDIYWNLEIFLGVRPEYPEENLWARRGPIAKSTHIWCWAGIETWRHLWEASALTTAPSSLPVVCINNGCAVNFSHGMMTLCVLEWDWQDCSRGCYINNRLSQLVKLEMFSNGQYWTSRSYKIWEIFLLPRTLVASRRNCVLKLSFNLNFVFYYKIYFNLLRATKRIQIF